MPCPWAITVPLQAAVETTQGRRMASASSSLFWMPRAIRNGATNTWAYSINPAGAIAGYYGVLGVVHGLLRAPNGTLTTFDAPGAGTGFGQGTFALDINPAGEIAGQYNDNSNVYHGFLVEGK